MRMRKLIFFMNNFRASFLYTFPWVHDLLSRNQMEEIVDYGRLRPFFNAVQENDWKGVEEFVTKDSQTLISNIKIGYKESIFHILAKNLNAPIWLWEKIVSMAIPESLERLKDTVGQSALFHASYYGNRKAAEALVRRNNELPNLKDHGGFLPVQVAAQNGQKETTQYLLSVTRMAPMDDYRRAHLLYNLIDADLYDLALDLLKRYPEFACLHYEDRGRILEIMASKPLAFESGTRFGYWKRLIYKWIPLQEEPIPQPESVEGDVENPIPRSKNLNSVTTFGHNPRQIFTALGAWPQKLHTMLWNALMKLVPDLKCIGDTKLMHMQALEIVRIMCHEGVIWSDKAAGKALYAPLMSATKFGIYELFNEILKAYFYIYAAFDRRTGHSILHLTILHRQEKIFSLINKKNLLLWSWKGINKMEKTNILHLAGKLVISSQVPGAALQMQRELQWFKAVERYVHPSLQQQRNRENQTPRELFTEEHKKLVKEGEKWIKGTATSCTIVAALIITVVFAAAFTVPGGSDCPEALPVFLHKPFFIVFVISDALALFSSTASLLMFLGILTSRYAEEDFLESLPKKLIIGLITLFLSIASMMVAFGATIYIFLSQPWKWTIIPISLLGCLPVTLFALLQFPLLVEIYSSTYCSTIIDEVRTSK